MAGRWVTGVLGGVLMVAAMLTGPTAVARPDCGPNGRLLPAVDGEPATCEHVTPPPPGVELGRDISIEELGRRPGAAGGGARVAAATDPRQVPCDPGDGLYRVQAVYVYDAARPAGRPGGDRYDSVKPMIQQWAAGMDRIFLQSAQKTGGERRIRWVTEPDGKGGCVVSVAKVASSAAALDEDGLYGVRTDLIMAGHDRHDRRYLAWTDATSQCGTGTVFGSSTTAGQDNLNNGPGGAGYGRIDTPCWGQHESIEVHELMHTIGAVVNGAPNGTPMGHCTDESDLMCYDEDGPGPIAMQQICPGQEAALLDCNNDDYFSTNPEPGSWLSRNWNTADSRFLIGGGDGTRGGTRGTTRVTLTAAPAPAGAGTRLTATITSPDTHTPAWSTGTAGCVITPDGLTATLRCPLDVRQAQVTFTARAPGTVDRTASRIVTFPARGAVDTTAGGTGGVRTFACLPGTATGKVTVADAASGSGYGGVGVLITRRGTPVARGVTGPDGVALVDIPATGTAIYEAHLEHPGFSTARVGYVRVTRSCTPDQAPAGVAALTAGPGGPATATGRATVQGVPAEHLPVVVTHPDGTATTRTDADGRWQATWTASTAGPVTVKVGDARPVPVGTLTISDWSTTVLARQQGPTPSLAGLAWRTAPGSRAPQPVPGGTVTVTVGGWSTQAPVDPAGRFRVDVPAAQARPGAAWRVTLTRPGHRTASATGTFTAPADVLVRADPIVPSYDGTSPAVLSGSLRNASGGFVNGPAELTIDVTGADGTTRTLPVSAGPDGFWRVELAPSGMSAVAISARLPGGQATADAPQLMATRGLTTDLLLDRVPTAGPGGPVVRGHLELPAGHQDLGVLLAGRTVNLVHRSSAGTGTVTTTMNPDGTFSAQLPVEGSYAVNAALPEAFPFATLYSVQAGPR